MNRIEQLREQLNEMINEADRCHHYYDDSEGDEQFWDGRASAAEQILSMIDKIDVNSSAPDCHRCSYEVFDIDEDDSDFISSEPGFTVENLS